VKLVAIFPLAVAVASIASSWAQSPGPASPDASPREHGRKIFAGHCAKCHDEDARKKLGDGSTLLTRLAASKDPGALLATRLKSMNDEDRRGVNAYVNDLLASFRSSLAKPAERH
jgi:mono/diheme cytochrome c family protein